MIILPLAVLFSAIIALGIFVQSASGQTSSAIEGMDASAPVLKNAAGQLLDSTSDGQLVVLSTTVSSTKEEPQPYVAIMEARDEAGMTRFLGFAIGDLAGNSQSEIGISWTPEEAGSYELRTFLVSEFENPQLLTAVATGAALVE
jgi:hypothetical protein